MEYDLIKKKTVQLNSIEGSNVRQSLKDFNSNRVPRLLRCFVPLKFMWVQHTHCIYRKTYLQPNFLRIISLMLTMPPFKHMCEKISKRMLLLISFLAIISSHFAQKMMFILTTVMLQFNSGTKRSELFTDCVSWRTCLTTGLPSF